MRTTNFIVILFITCCYSYSDVQFSERPRNFSIEVLYHTQIQTDGHVVISPFGIWTLMTGLAVGTTGETFEQLRVAFILPRSLKTAVNGFKILTTAVLKEASDGVSLTSKNYVFVDDSLTLNPVFRKTIVEDFDANIKVLDFRNPGEASYKANSFMKDSGGRVSHVLTSEDFANSRLILTNVISFKGIWTSPFKTSDTNVENFYNEDKEVVGRVNMMYQKGKFAISNIANLKAFVCELLYGTDGKYSMLIILPHSDTRLQDTYKRLAAVTLPEIAETLQQDVDEYGLDEVELKLPRFKISTNVVMNKPLNDMGVYDIFEPDLAGFERMTNESLFVSAIVHKADIEVSETGTVATASTSAVLADRILSSTRLTVNRPFIYFIIEKTTTTVIFGGVYSKPTLF